MKVFVTGRTGRLGRALVPELVPRGHAWLSVIPSTHDGAARLGLVTRRQMVSALVRSVEQPPDGYPIVDVPEIRAARL